MNDHTTDVTAPIEKSNQTSIHSLAFNPYISGNSVFIDDDHRIFLLDDDRLTYLHQWTDENLNEDKQERQITLQWDASPFLYTIADNHRNTCLLFDLRLRNEPQKELFVNKGNHAHLSQQETLRGYQSSVINPYQHIFLTDFSLMTIDSRMANRAVIV